MARQVEPSPRALEGLMVLELPTLDNLVNLAAPMAGKSFADLGAEVIKVEPPKIGAPERKLGPFRDDLRNPETGGLHLYLNTNKLSLTLKLEDSRARGLLYRLCESADIVFNPNLPSQSEELGLGWRGLIERFPRLIVVSITCFGIESGYRDLRGSDLIATQMSGVGYQTPFHQVTDPPNEPPLRMADHQADYLAGYTAAAAAMCSIFARQASGTGQHVDVSEWLAMVSMIRPSIGAYSHESPEAPTFKRFFTRRKANVQWVYPCADGWVSFSAITDRFWPGTKRAMGNPEWAEGEMFNTFMARAANADAVEAALMAWLATQKKDEVFRKAQAEHVPCFPVHSPAEVAENEQYRARGFFVDHEHPVAGRVRMPGAPCAFSRTPWRIRRAAPRLGEHNRTILCERLELSEGEVAALAAEGLI